MEKHPINTFYLLPRPLLTPSLWPEPTSGVVWLLPLDVATVAGGVLHRQLSAMADAGSVAWFIPAKFFATDRPAQASIRREEARAWLNRQPASILISDHPEQLENLTKQNINRADFAVPDSRAWAEEIFPQLRRSAGDVWLRRALAKFEKELGCKIEFAWEDLRFFSGYLRQAREPDHAVLADREWAHFQALYSPQDESMEAARLGLDRLALNPTVQTLRLKDQLKLVYRKGTEVEEAIIGWREALLIDEISELARQTSGELLEKVSHEAAGAERTFDDPKNRPQGAPDFPKALAHLIERGILLQGS